MHFVFFNQSLVISSQLKTINLGTFDNNVLGLAVDKDVVGAGHVSALGEVDDQEEAGAGEGVVELVEVLAMPALDNLQQIFLYFFPALAITNNMTKLNQIIKKYSNIPHKDKVFTVKY